MRKLITLSCALLIAACDGPPGVIDLDRTGVLVGSAYVDRDADGRLSDPDVPAFGLATALVREASGDTVARAAVRADGSFVMSNVPVGRYRLVARLGTLGDTLEVQKIDSATVSISASDTAEHTIRVGYPTLRSGALRQTPAGRRVIVEGIALNSWATFGDSTIHLHDSDGAIRAIRVQTSTVQAGDSIRILGVTGVTNGRQVLADARAHLLAGARGLPAVDSVSTQEAATAGSGARADGQVRIAGALIRDTTFVAGELVLGVDDGSGRVEVLLDRHISFDAGAWAPGGTFSGAGVLVAATNGGGWQLKPRNRTEAVLTFPTTSIADARAAEQGRRIVIEGIALNAWSTFADSTVHIFDQTGVIRAVRVTGTNVLAGDSVRMLGTVSTRDQQPVLSNVTASLILRGVAVPVPDSVSTAIAASAAGGTRDAGQVRVRGTIVGTQDLPGGDRILNINDGSGLLRVLLDRDVNFGQGPFVPDVLLTATGLLVPTGTGAWQLKPRFVNDVSSTYPTVTVAEARALPAGKVVYIHGLTLNGRVTFTDGAVHLFDRQDAIRVLGLPSMAVFAGDSVRFLGTVGIRNGQPVLTNASGSALMSGVGVPAPDSLSTADAARARADTTPGALDARLVAISGTIEKIDTIAGGDLRLHVNDGTDTLAVFLDRSIGFAIGAYAKDARLRARGVLVPEASGTKWELKPRTVADVVITQVAPPPASPQAAVTTP
jgi:hypothetical protein